MKKIVFFAVVGLVASPVFACGPGNGGGSGGQQTQQQGQHHRRHHRERTDGGEAEYERNRRFIHEDNRGELLLESIDGGHGTYSKYSPAETQRRMEARASHLLMKYKKGTLTNNEATELTVLMHSLSH